MCLFLEGHPETPLIVFGSNISKELSEIYKEHQVETPLEEKEVSISKKRRLIRKKAQKGIYETYKMQKINEAAAREKIEQEAERSE